MTHSITSNTLQKVGHIKADRIGFITATRSEIKTAVLHEKQTGEARKQGSKSREHVARMRQLCKIRSSTDTTAWMRATLKVLHPVQGSLYVSEFSASLEH